MPDDKDTNIPSQSEPTAEIGKRSPSAKVTVTEQKMTFQLSEGPLPPPDILEAYDRVVPNGADRIMALAERQSQHRQDMEAKVIDGNVWAQRFGVIATFTLTFTAMILGALLVFLGKNAYFGSLLSFAGLGGALISRILGRKAQDRERQKKSEPFRDANPTEC